jgi:hypothetical protein
MATITNLTSAQKAIGTSLNVAGVTVQKYDYLFMFIANYASTLDSFSNLNGITFPGEQLTTAASTPNLNGYAYFGEQTQTVTNQTITLNFSGSNPTAVIIFRVRPDEGSRILAKSLNVLSSQPISASFSLSTTLQVTSDSIIVGGCAVADDTTFTDSDTTNGSWSSVYSQFSTAGADLGVFGQTKVVTGDGQQTWNGTWATGQSEWASGYVFNVYEVEFPRWGVLNR